MMKLRGEKKRGGECEESKEAMDASLEVRAHIRRDKAPAATAPPSVSSAGLKEVFVKRSAGLEAARIVEEERASKAIPSVAVYDNDEDVPPLI